MNPVRDLRERIGLTMNELALILGVAYTAVAHVELGRATAVPGAWRETLTKAGADFDRLAADYVQWRQEARDSLEASIEARVIS